MNAATATRFVGWWRAGNGHKWQEVCAAGSESACWDVLLERAPAGGDKTVAAAGTYPWHRPAEGARPRRRF
jgi:hypothetical protein